MKGKNYVIVGDGSPVRILPDNLRGETYPVTEELNNGL